MIHKIRPEGFDPKFECVACIVEHEGEIVLLHRQDHKSEGNTWGLPAGKIAGEESADEAIAREIFEETGFRVGESKPIHFTTLDIGYPGYDFVYHLYHLKIDEKPEVKINPKEHKNFKWASIKEALEINLIGDLDECLKMFYK